MLVPPKVFMIQRRRFAILLLISLAGGLAVWSLLRCTTVRHHLTATSGPANLRTVDELWAEGVEKVRADRAEPELQVALQIPSELQHYTDRRWFLATQVAEVHRQNVQSCQDYVALAALIQRGEMVPVPAATEDYILFGVGARADDSAFSRFEDDQTVPLYNEAQLRDEYARLETARAQAQNQIAALKQQAAALKKGQRAKQAELQKDIAGQQQQLTALDEQKASLDRSYATAENRQKLFSEYDAFQTLAQHFGGRSYDLGNPSDRQTLKVNMLRSLRPAAFTVMKEIAASYQQKFNRPLPVSSLVRPEQYQRVLRKVNRAATTIDTPPHSTGLAFDIDYRYMSGAEQNFVMSLLAQLKTAGRIEVLRERNANYHVFAFVDGTRPPDALITASLEEIGPGPAEEANHATEAKPKAAAAKTKPTKPNRKTAKPAKSKPRKRR